MGEFFGHIARAVKTDPSKKTLRRTKVEESDRGDVVLRRTTIEEIEFKNASDEATKRASDEG